MELKQTIQKYEESQGFAEGVKESAGRKKSTSSNNILKLIRMKQDVNPPPCRLSFWTHIALIQTSTLSNPISKEKELHYKSVTGP